MYLVAKVSKMALPNCVIAWELSAINYDKKACKHVTNYLERDYEGWTLNRKVSTTFTNGYLLELDISPELNEEQVYFYH